MAPCQAVNSFWSEPARFRKPQGHSQNKSGCTHADHPVRSQYKAGPSISTLAFRRFDSSKSSKQLIVVDATPGRRLGASQPQSRFTRPPASSPEAVPFRIQNHPAAGNHVCRVRARSIRTEGPPGGPSTPFGAAMNTSRHFEMRSVACVYLRMRDDLP